MRRLWAVPRVTAVVAVVAAIGATFAAARPPVVVWNFFGYFTIQSNLIIAITLAFAASGIATGRPTSTAVRGAATTYIALTGLVYNTLLVGIAGGGVAVPWANVVLHTVIPLCALLDWVLAPDLRTLPWRTIWIVLPYPIVWLTVVLIRGATDGWVPYPFLDPATGYGSVLTYCILIAGFVLALAAAVWALSRARLGPEAAARPSP